MGKPTGFQEYQRKVPTELPIEERIQNYDEFLVPLSEQDLKKQGARCMDCGVPFCHSGCPLGNVIPEFNDAVYSEDWKLASEILHSTNNFPEITGRLCPAPCEEACVLGINEPAVTIKNIEYSISERAFLKGWLNAEPPAQRTEKRVIVVGSGPSGLACAVQLNRAGHSVTVYERSDKIGGLLRYGIPDFKLEKYILDKRISLLSEEGIEFRTSINVGQDISLAEMQAQADAVVLCIGATKSRDLPILGRDLRGVHLAMEFLPQQNRRVSKEDSAVISNGWWFSKDANDILSTGKRVIVIGGGDTGADCVGTSIRQGAKSVTQFELLPKPSLERPCSQPWPFWPNRLRTGSSHKEGCERVWSILTKEFVGEDGRLTGLRTVLVEWKEEKGGRPTMHEISGSEKIWSADLVLLALGFLGPEQEGLISDSALETDNRSNIKTQENYMTSIPGVFSCGDSRRGQSLVVWAISEGREAAREIDCYLMGQTSLPTKGEGDLPRV